MKKRTNTAVWNDAEARWRISVQRDGRRRTFYSSRPGRTGQREANAKADAWLDENIDSGDDRVEDLFEDFLLSKKKTTSSTNYRPMESRWMCHVDPVIGNKRIENVRQSDLQKIIDNACARGLSRKSLRNIRGDLSSFYKYARRCGAPTMIPELDIPVKAPASEKKILQPDDLTILFRSDATVFKGRTCSEPFIRAYRLQVLTGMRPGEILGLQWKDIQQNSIRIRRAVNIRGEVTAGKNANAIRSVPLSDPARELLEEQRAITGRDKFVFDIQSEKTYHNHLVRYCRYNNITEVTPYELRHTFVSIAKTMPQGFVKDLVGHSEDMDTFAVYGHHVNGEQEKVTQHLNKLFGEILLAEDDEFEGMNYNL